MIVKYFQTIENDLKSIGFNEGTLYYTTDTKRVYLDPVDERSRICVSSDPITLNTENDRTDLLAPIPGKIYFVIETSKSYIFHNGNWYDTYKELPNYSAEDNDKVLKIVDGALKWTEIESGSDILKAPKLIINALPGSTITCSNGSITKVGTENNGQYIFNDLTLNEVWTITAIWNGVIVTKNVTFTEIKIEFIDIQYRMTPDFTYTGDYEIVDDTDSKIIDFPNWTENWKIRFLTSGTLIFTNLYGWNGTIDAFLVGGGGGGGGSGSGSTNQISGTGGGGGYTKTERNIIVTLLTEYEIVVGSGGSSTSGEGNAPSGGKTSAFGIQVNGGVGGSGRYGTRKGGNGGSGGGGGGTGTSAGGTDGSDGKGTAPGKGQGTTTREFEEPDGTLYSNGGPCGKKTSGATNTGNGGGGAAYHGGTSAPGGSGIVIIRNIREAA